MFQGNLFLHLCLTSLLLSCRCRNPWIKWVVGDIPAGEISVPLTLSENEIHIYHDLGSEYVPGCVGKRSLFRKINTHNRQNLRNGERKRSILLCIPGTGRMSDISHMCYHNSGNKNCTDLSQTIQQLVDNVNIQVPHLIVARFFGDDIFTNKVANETINQWNRGREDAKTRTSLDPIVI